MCLFKKVNHCSFGTKSVLQVYVCVLGKSLFFMIQEKHHCVVLCSHIKIKPMYAWTSSVICQCPVLTCVNLRLNVDCVMCMRECVLESNCKSLKIPQRCI